MKKLLLLTMMTLLGVPSLTKADIQDRLHDFTDAYYQQNGINPLPSMVVVRLVR
jgi:hypothetical protein